MASTPASDPTPDEKGFIYGPDGTPYFTPGPSPVDYIEAARAWLEEAEDMRAAQGGFVTQGQALGYATAYGTLALAGTVGRLADLLGWPGEGDVDPREAPSAEGETAAP